MIMYIMNEISTCYFLTLTITQIVIDHDLDIIFFSRMIGKSFYCFCHYVSSANTLFYHNLSGADLIQSANTNPDPPCIQNRVQRLVQGCSGTKAYHCHCRHTGEGVRIPDKRQSTILDPRYHYRSTLHFSTSQGWVDTWVYGCM